MTFTNYLSLFSFSSPMNMIKPIWSKYMAVIICFMYVFPHIELTLLHEFIPYIWCHLNNTNRMRRQHKKRKRVRRIKNSGILQKKQILIKISRWFQKFYPHFKPMNILGVGVIFLKDTNRFSNRKSPHMKIRVYLMTESVFLAK